MARNYMNDDEKNELKQAKSELMQFFVGLAMLIVGGYLFMENVEVTTASIFSFSLMGRRMDGLIFVPLIASIIFLFFKYNIISKICVGLSLLLIVANVIMNLNLYWRATTLFATIIIFVLLFGGLGLVCRVLFANPDGKHGKNYKDQ